MKPAFWICIVLAGGIFGEGPAFAASLAASLPHEMLSAHNAVRSRAGTPPLTWSAQLTSVAQQWADHLLKDGQFVHSHNPDFGENLYEIEGAPASPAEVVKAWADEAADYNYAANTCRGVCGHYTQVVWRGTKQVGCAVARDARREVWVCEYNPPGNWVGQKPY